VAVRDGGVSQYAARRTDSPEDTEDVMSETFLTAWRRIADVPEGEAARLWLYGVARRVLANQRRGQSRRAGLAERLKDKLSAARPSGRTGSTMCGRRSATFPPAIARCSRSPAGRA
jgi:DNA-directed RNA polymerase specialized sigma24 family protein